MNKAEIMRQSSMDTLLEEMIKHKPGVTSARLFDLCKEWAGKTWVQSDTHKFELALDRLHGRYRCTNKQWYPANHKEPPARKGPKAEDARQLRMFG